MKDKINFENIELEIKKNFGQHNQRKYSLSFFFPTINFIKKSIESMGDWK